MEGRDIEAIRESIESWGLNLEDRGQMKEAPNTELRTDRPSAGG